MKIGVDYYPEHWTNEIIINDIKLMKETGVKIVRLAEFAWCRLEPTEGSYDFKWLDDVIELFAENNIEVILGTPTCTPPLWLYEKYPDAVQVDKNNNKIFTGIRGHRCYNSPSVLHFTRLIVQEMAEHYKNNQAVIGYQIDNELEPNQCCCENCADAFKKYLKNKYKTLESINEAYGNVVWSGEYSSWDQVKMPLGGSIHLNPSYLLDFEKYAASSMTSYINFQAEIIREISPDKLITTNTWFPENVPYFHDSFKKLDFVSYDNYPSTKVITDDDSLHSHAFHCDLMRGVKQKNFWIMEQLSGPIGAWMPMTRTTKPGMIKGYSMQAIARGADNVIHFRWRSACKGAEMFWHGLIDHSNVPGRRFHEFEDLCSDVNKISSLLDGSVINNDIAILHSSVIESAFKIQPQTDGMYYLEQLQLFHKALLRLGVSSDIIDVKCDVSKYKIVIAPTLFISDDSIKEKLDTFVQNGGILILTNRSGVKDVNNNCVMSPLPGVFSECAGITISEYDPLGNDVSTIKYEGKTYNCTQWCDIINPDTADTIAVYNEDFYKGLPAVTVNSYKYGKVYYVGTVSCIDFYYDFMKNIIQDTSIAFYDNLPKSLELSVRENKNGRFLFVFNNSNNSVTFDHNTKCRNILSNEENTVFSLKPYECIILK